MNCRLQYVFFKTGRSRFVCCSVIIFLFLFTSHAYSQRADDYDEVSLTVNVPRVGSWEMPGIIKGQSAYLPVKELFDVLQIKNSLSSNLDSITGFFINPKAEYVIDRMNNLVQYQGKTYDIKPGDIFPMDNKVYLKTDYFGEIFGLECVFNFRSLSITINTKLELPAIREMQIEQMRRNITQLKGERKADTVIKRKFSLFHLGMADWSVINYKQDGGDYNYTRLTANIGGIVAGGETNAYLNYTSGTPFLLDQQYFRWRYVDNDNSALRQVVLGNIFVQTTASVYGPIQGFQISNTPTTYRRSFGTYRLTNTTEPGWTVELYVNNVLINYTKADASGIYTFEVPLVYGSSNVKLRFYSPWGEERSKEENISIPFNFLPVHEFEYTLSGGVINDDDKGKFSQLNLNYGVSNHLTVGGGVEYLSTVLQGKFMPFLNTSFRIGNNLMVSAEHTYGVRTKATINYRLPSSLQAEIDYTKYAPGQTAIRSGKSSITNYLDEKKAMLFMPFHMKTFSGFSRLSFSQLSLPTLKYTTAELLFSGIYKSINANLTTSKVYTDPVHPLTYTNLAVSFRVLKNIRVTPQAQYDYNEKNFSMFKFETEKSLWNKGFLIFNYEKNITYHSDNFSIGFRYNFSFAQTTFTATRAQGTTSYIESARGSILYDDQSTRLKLSDQSNVGRGGLVIMPFLDLNCNGKYDKGEPKVQNLKLRINGGRIEHNKDTTISVAGLEAYTNYFIEFDKGSLDNIGWQLRKSTMNIVIEPNRFKLVEVPISVVGEAEGTVYQGTAGLGKIIVNFYNKDSVLVGRTISEGDGYFSFVGLPPGSYTAEPDKAQLQKLNMSSIPASVPVTIRQTRDGDIVEGLKFVIKKNEIIQ